MTATTVQHSSVSGLVSSPRGVRPLGEDASVLHQIKVSYPALTTNIDETGDIILLTPLPATAKISSIKVFNDDLDGNATPALAVDVGLYKMTHDGTVTVLDADAYASAITTLQAANLTGVEVAFESTVKDINNADMTKRVFEDAGLSAVPNDGFIVLGLTVTTGAATAAAGDVMVHVNYTM